MQCVQRATNVTFMQEAKGLITFAEYVKGPAFPFDTSLYTNDLIRWLQYFKREQFFIVRFDYLTNRSGETLKRIAKFLNLKTSFPANIKLPHDNTAVIETTLDCKTRDELAAQYAASIEDLYSFMESNYSATKPRSEPKFGHFSTVPLKCAGW